MLLPSKFNASKGASFAMKHFHDKRSRRSGFTLVEILVVLVILSIMGSMVVTATSGVTRSARESRTRTIISLCDSVIQDLYDSTKYRPLPVEIPTLRSARPTGTLSREVLVSEAARVRLIMRRDLQRMELPDRFSDFVSEVTGTVDRPVPSPIYAAANPVLLNGSNEVVGSRNAPASRQSFIVTWNAPQRVFSYLERFNSVASPTTINQGAECLFMIMSSTFIAGEPAIAAIPSSHIGDTDNDGFREILDAWGNPLGFIRWPVGFADPNSDGTRTPDDFDPFRADFANLSGASAALATDVSDGANKVPWSMRPLIVSAGSDGAVGIALDPYTEQASVANGFSYSDTLYNLQSNATVATNFMRVQADGRAASANNYHYPDPYLRRFLALNASAVLPGQVFSNVDAQEAVADNITNYSLQVQN